MEFKRKALKNADLKKLYEARLKDLCIKKNGNQFERFALNIVSKVNNRKLNLHNCSLGINSA